MKKKPLSSEEVMTRARKAVKEGRVRLAPTDEIDRLEKYVDMVLRAIAVGMGQNPDKFSCLVTDRSSLSDFSPGGDEDEKFYEVVSRELDTEVKRGEHLIAVAKRLMD